MKTNYRDQTPKHTCSNCKHHRHVGTPDGDYFALCYKDSEDEPLKQKCESSKFIFTRWYLLGEEAIDNVEEEHREWALWAEKRMVDWNGCGICDDYEGRN